MFGWNRRCYFVQTFRFKSGTWIATFFWTFIRSVCHTIYPSVTRIFIRNTSVFWMETFKLILFAPQPRCDDSYKDNNVGQQNQTLFVGGRSILLGHSLPLSWTLNLFFYKPGRFPCPRYCLHAVISRLVLHPSFHPLGVYTV